jgi:D-beta-D-heptose 7-phosphate kinase/D-beta-D-heptose 1-phosphate adenosyltransferase
LGKSRFGFVNGCFDLFHVGHRRFLVEARKHCDQLMVAVNEDDSVRRLKGAARPVHKLLDRMTYVCEFADVVTGFDGDVRTLIKRVNPDVLIRGWDQSTEEYGLAPVFIQLPRYLGISTTMLLEELNGL